MNMTTHRLRLLLAAFVLTGLVLAGLGLSVAPVQAKSAARAAVSHIVTGGRGTKPAIKGSRDQANKNPKRLSSGKPRSGTLHIDNHTEYYIDIYVDGDYSGTVTPYGDLYLYNPADDVIVSGDVPGTTLYFSGHDIAVPGVWHLYD